MDDKLNYIQAKVDKLDDRLDSIDKTLAVNTALLDEHIKRTAMLEDRVSEVTDHVHGLKGAAKIIKWAVGIISTISGIIMTIWQLRSR